MELGSMPCKGLGRTFWGLWVGSRHSKHEVGMSLAPWRNRKKAVCLDRSAEEVAGHEGQSSRAASPQRPGRPRRVPRDQWRVLRRGAV